MYTTSSTTHRAVFFGDQLHQETATQLPSSGSTMAKDFAFSSSSTTSRSTSTSTPHLVISMFTHSSIEGGDSDKMLNVNKASISKTSRVAVQQEFVHQAHQGAGAAHQSQVNKQNRSSTSRFNRKSSRRAHLQHRL